MSGVDANANAARAPDVGESGPPGPMTAPYVGVRALNRNERELLVGRDTDIQFLGDKILTGPLTVFYGRSGLGKTSLLKAALIPELGDEGAIVTYVDSWAQADPLAAVKRALVERARAARISNAGGGAPTLTELAQLLAAGTGQTVILILDQFEEFLFAHAGNLDPLRREIASLVRSSVDAHVVLSMREEFLAVLEPFREEILTLFSSTYRLEPLPESELRKAITVPAGIFRVAYDALLVDRLLADLHEEEAERLSRGHTGGGTPVELPFLQLVCQQLWESRGPDQNRLDVAMYEALGGVRTILSTYVQSVMPAELADRRSAAEVLKYVAPPTGLKVAYSLDHLTSLTGLGRDGVEALLTGWARAFILRVRTEDGGPKYELLHDALIAVLGPWRDAVLEEARVWRRWRRVVKAALLAGAGVLAVLGVSIFVAHRELQEQTNDLVSSSCRTGDGERSSPAAPDSEAKCTGAFDTSTAYLLWRYDRSDRFATLIEFLADHARELPAGYGMSHPDARLLRSPVESWPNTLEYSPKRHMDAVQFGWIWQDQASRIVDDLGIPVPLRLRLVARDGAGLDETHVRLTIAPADPIDFEVPLSVGASPFAPSPAAPLPQPEPPPPPAEDGAAAAEDVAFVSISNPTSSALSHHFEAHSQWVSLPRDKFGPGWWRVPRWSLPAWKVSGQTVTDSSGIVAVSVAAQLRKQRKLLVFPAVVDYLLDTVDRTTRMEAFRARPTALREDVVAAVESGARLVQMPALLELMAEQPQLEADELVKVLTLERPRPQAHLRGKSWTADALAGSAKSPIFKAPPRTTETAARSELPGYDEARERMRTPSPALRVYWSEKAAAWWEQNHVEARKRVEAALDRFATRYGIEPKEVELHADTSLHDDELRVGSPADPTDSPGVLGPGRAVLHCRRAAMFDDLVEQLDLELESRLTLWIDAPFSRWAVATAPPGLAKWLEEHFTTTDLKLILRAVVDPGSGAGETRSLRHKDWLLASLVFWSFVEKGDLPEDVAARLRSTQAARVSGATTATPSEDVRLGIAALEKDDPAGASSRFDRALKGNRDAAIASFLSSYGSVARAFDARQLLARGGHRDDRSSPLRRVERADLAEMDGFPAIAPGPDASARRASQIEFAAAALESYDPTRGNTDILDFVRKVLRAAMLSATPDQADDVYKTVADVCQEGGPKNWCWQLLDELCAVRKDPRLKLELAFQMSNLDGGPFLRRAAALAHELTPVFATSMIPAWLKVIEAQSVIRSDPDDPTSLTRARDLLATVGRDEDAYLTAVSWLTTLSLAASQKDTARDLLAEWQRRLPSAEAHYDLYATEASFDASYVDLDNAVREATRAAEDAELHGRSSVGAIGLGLVIGKDPEWWEKKARTCLDARSRHSEYVRLLLFARLWRSDPLEAKRLVAGSNVDPSWDARASAGDPAVWREMLLAYYADRISREALFAPIMSEAAFHERWQGAIAQERGGMLCEAWFYDALLAGARGRENEMRDGMATVLQKCTHTTYTEYELARHVLDGHLAVP